jgi:Fe-S-cluster containining protein
MLAFPAESRARVKRNKRGDKRGDAVRRDGQGRAHLVIQRDGYGREVGLALSAPLFNDAWQNDVAVAVAATAHARLGEGHTRAQAVALGRDAMAAASKIVDGALAQSPDRPPACRAGCAHCCYQAVGVTPPEVFAIWDHLRVTRTPAELEAVTARVRAADDRTRGLSSAERLSPELPCPFLVDARCSIYEARPLSCRGTNALDAGACERNLRDPDARAAFLAGAASVPCYLEPIRAGHAVSAGMQLALDQLHGLEVAPLELTAAVRVMLDDPDGVPERWLGGKDPFAAARGADMTDDPRSRALSGRRAD